MEYIALIIIALLVLLPLHFNREQIQKQHITMRVFISALFGSFLTVMLGLPILIMAVSGLPDDYDFFSFRIGEFFDGIGGGVGFTFLGLFIAAPFLLLAVSAAALFRKNIENNPLPWCAAATALGPFVYAVCLYDPASAERSFDKILFSSLSFLIFWGFFMASLVFLYINPPKPVTPVD